MAAAVAAVEVVKMVLALALVLVVGAGRAVGVRWRVPLWPESERSCNEMCSVRLLRCVLGVLGARYWMLGVVAVAVVDVVGGGGGLIVGVTALTHRQNLVDWSRDRPQ